jgi:hypothetical protein
MTQVTREIEFIFPLSEELEDRLRVFALKRKNRVVKFVVQYEALISDRWRSIVRYDTSHGFAHKDILHFRGEEDKQPLYFQDFKMAFTFAIQDLKTSWKWYRMAYEREMENEESSGH